MLSQIENSEMIERYILQFHQIKDIFSSNDKIEYNKFVELINNFSGLSELIINHADKKILHSFNNQENLKKSIIYIGIPAVKNLAIYYLSKPFFFSGNSSGKFDFNSYWKHCLGTSVAGKLIAQKICPEEKYKIFTYGLIHDLGVGVINKCLPNKIAQVTDLMRTGMEQIEAEKVVLEGYSHEDIGKWLCVKLGLGEELSDVISNHHCKKSFGEVTFVNKIISVSDLISTEYYQRLLGFKLHSKLYEKISKFDFIDKKTALDISIKLPSEVLKIEYLYS